MWLPANIPYMIICESWVLLGATILVDATSEDFDHFANGIPEHFRLRQFKSLKKHPAVLTKCAERLPSCFLQGMSTLTNCRNLSKAWCATTRSHLLLEKSTRGVVQRSMEWRRSERSPGTLRKKCLQHCCRASSTDRRLRLFFFFYSKVSKQFGSLSRACEFLKVSASVWKLPYHSISVFGFSNHRVVLWCSWC